MKKLFATFIVALIANASFACSASFTSSAAPVPGALLTYSFSNTSSYGTVPSGYFKMSTIFYGDGSSAGISSSAAHNYSSTGTYSVKLVIKILDSSTSSVYCADSTTTSVTVSYPPCGITLSDTTHSGGAVGFRASCPAGTTGLTYFWNFGDGNFGTGNPVSHTYAYNGTYNVTCYDTGSTCNSYDTIHVTISTAASPYPCSSFTPKFTTSVSGSTVTCTNTSTHPSGTTAYGHVNWEHGDGTSYGFSYTSDVHTYSATGTYVITLVENWEDSAGTTLYCTDSVKDTVVITSLTHAITGSVIRDSTYGTVGADSVLIWLITLDTSTHIITAVDSEWRYGYGTIPYSFSSIAAGSYLVKAAIWHGPTSGAGWVPTYSDTSIYWSGANNVNVTTAGTVIANIHMKYGTATSGPGFIAGNVLYGAGKASGSHGTVGAPDAGLLIYLRNASNKMIAFTYTGADGNYSFSNVPIGTYSIYPEDIGIKTTAWTSVTLTSSSLTATARNFTENSTSITPVPMGISEVATNASISIHPNPANNNVTIQWNASVSEAVTVTITNITGQKVYTASLTNSGGTEQINLANMNSGMYLMNIRTTNTNYTEKLIIQH